MQTRTDKMQDRLSQLRGRLSVDVSGKKQKQI